MVMKILKKTMLMLSATLLVVGCSKDAGQEVLTDGPDSDGGKIEMTFGLAATRLSGAASLPASGLTEDQESAVNNVWVLQFDNTGKLVLHEYYDQFTSVSATDKKLSVALIEDTNSKVYFVANVGADCFKTLAAATTLTAFEKQTLDFSGWAGSAGTTGLPMVGVYSGSTTAAPSAVVPLTRLVSKVVFTCTVALNSTETTLSNGKVLPADQLRLNRVQITNAASKVQYAAHAVSGSNPVVCPVFPANATEADLADNYLSYDEDTSVDGQTTFTFTWYLPENLKGAVDGLTESNKGPKNAPAGSTCIEISGDYTTSTYVPNEATPDDLTDEVLATTIKDVTYCIYPGQNETTDFNLIRNYSYTITTTIKGISDADTRVRVEKGIPAGEYSDGVWPEDAPVAGE